MKEPATVTSVSTLTMAVERDSRLSVMWFWAVRTTATFVN